MMYSVFEWCLRQNCSTKPAGYPLFSVNESSEGGPVCYVRSEPLMLPWRGRVRIALRFLNPCKKRFSIF